MLFNSVVYVNFVYAWISSPTKLLLSIVDLYKYFLLPSLIVHLYKYFGKTMAGIKCIHYLQVCETIRRMIKHFSTYKSTMRCTIPRQIQYQVRVISKAEATILLIEQMLGQIQVTYSDKKKD